MNMVYAWLLTTLVALTAAWDGNKDNCPLPPRAELYNPNPEVTVRTVSWTYDNEFLCYSDKPCQNHSNAEVNGTIVHTQDLHMIQEMFPDTTDDLSGADVSTAGTTVQPTRVTGTSPSDGQPVQLKPIMLQLGNILKFTPILSLSTPFTMMVHEVDEAGFLTCNTSRGIPILAAEANDTFEVPHKFLEPGVHYFIGSSELNIVARCEFGLRLNVTVKFNNCYTDHNTPCSGLGMCITFPNEPQFQCHCCGNYRGETCQILDSCMSNPCKNGGLCVHPGNNTLEYVCECPLGYFGDYCLDHAENLCDVVNCSNNSTCSGNSTHFQCDCPPGLTGTHCEVDINDCQPSPCSFGQCVDQRNGFKCVCNPGYYGHVCSEVHSPCDLNPCQNGGYCQETKTKSGDFAFICHCSPGWGAIACTDVVPVCLPNPCKHGRCVSVKTKRHSSFTCKCDPGFTGSRCEVNINDCDPNPCKFGGHCKDGIHSHNCLCLHSHAGSNCQFTLDLFSPILEDVDIAGGIIHNPSHTRNLYIVAGTLTAAVVIMILVLIGCYCRISQSYHSCCCMSRWFWYKKDSDLVVNVDVTSAYECPLAVDSFWKHSDSETEALSSSSSRNSFQNHTV